MPRPTLQTRFADLLDTAQNVEKAIPIELKLIAGENILPLSDEPDLINFDPRELVDGFKLSDIDDESFKSFFLLAYCYQYGLGTSVNKTKAGQWYKKFFDNGGFDRISTLAQNSDVEALFILGCIQLLTVVREKPNGDKASEYFSRAANKDYAPAEYHLGRMYRYGEGGLPQDLFLAKMWIKRAADHGFAIAQCEWGRICRSEQQFTEALKYYLRAVKQGYTNAKYHAGLLYEEGPVGITKDVNTACHLFYQAALQGYASAEYRTGQMLEVGYNEFPQNITEAYLWFERAARQEHATAQYKISLMLEEGIGVDKNLEAAKHWRDKAAAQNYSEAQYEARTFNWNKKAARYGNVNAQIYCGKKYEKLGDIDNAKRLYSQAAEQDCAEAYYALGKLNQKENPKTAFDNFSEATRLLHADAQYELDKMYQSGYGKKGKNPASKSDKKTLSEQVDAHYSRGKIYEKKGEYKKARKYYQKAAISGNAKAEYRLGLFYSSAGPKSTPKNKKEAIRSLTNAATHGHQKAKEQLENLYQIKLG